MLSVAWSAAFSLIIGAAWPAERLAMCDVPVTKVRHPSYGGQADFLREIADLYKLPRKQPMLL